VALLEEPIKEVLQLQNYVNGEWIKSKSDQVIDVINPATQQLLACVPMSTRDEVNASVQAAKEAFPEWRSTPPLARVQYLFRLKELSEEHVERLSRVQSRECSYAKALKQALAVEEKMQQFYTDAAEQSKSLMADVPRTFTLLNNKRGKRIELLKSLIANTS